MDSLVGKDAEQHELLELLELYTIQLLWKTIWHYLLKCDKHIPYNSAIPIKITLNRNMHRHVPKDRYRNQSSCNSQTVETNQIHQYENKSIVAYLYNNVSFSNDTESTTLHTTWVNLNTEQRKPGTKEYMLYDSTYIKYKNIYNYTILSKIKTAVIFGDVRGVIIGA